MLKEIWTVSNYTALAKSDNSFSTRALRLLKTYGLILLSLLAVGPLIMLTDYLVVHLLHFNSIQKQQAMSIQQLIQKLGYGIAISYICLIGPLLEETIFRLPLSFKKTHIAWSLMIAFLLFSNLFPFMKSLYQVMGIYYAWFIRIAFMGLIYLAVQKFIPAKCVMAPRLKKWIIITSILLFGLMHISNYLPLHWSIIWIYPFYVLPQLAMGWGLTYIRFKNGFIWGVALHCVINSVSMMLSSQHAPPIKSTHAHRSVSAIVHTVR